MRIMRPVILVFLSNKYVIIVRYFSSSKEDQFVQ